MKSIILLYPGGFHGEFFIGNIVTNTDKFYYFKFFSRSGGTLNSYSYEAIERLQSDPDYDSIGPILENKYQTDDTVEYYSTWHGKPIITNSHDHITTRTLPVARLYTKDSMYERRGVLLQCIKLLDKHYSIKNHKPYRFGQWPKEMKHTTDSILHIDIKEWLHNENLEKIEDFFQVKYTQTMKDAVTQYYERDNVLLDKYFPTWQNQSDEQLIEEMSIVDNKFSFYYGSEKE